MVIVWRWWWWSVFLLWLLWICDVVFVESVVRWLFGLVLDELRSWSVMMFVMWLRLELGMVFGRDCWSFWIGWYSCDLFLLYYVNGMLVDWKLVVCCWRILLVYCLVSVWYLDSVGWCWLDWVVFCRCVVVVVGSESVSIFIVWWWLYWWWLMWLVGCWVLVLWVEILWWLDWRWLIGFGWGECLCELVCFLVVWWWFGWWF